MLRAWIHKKKHLSETGELKHGYKKITNNSNSKK